MRILWLLLAVMLAGCSIGNPVGTALISGTYDVVQAVTPNAVLEDLAAAMPYEADVFAPRGFFAPKPTIPPAVPSLVTDYPFANVAAPLHLLLIANSVKVTGTVLFSEPLGPHAWDHETFYLIPDNPLWMNQYAPDYLGRPFLEVEPPFGHPVPAEGQRVEATGPFTIDLSNGWVEIHPCFEWDII